MPISVIPNQPINLAFTERDSCLPIDNKGYCTSYQYGDSIKLQVKNASAASANCNAGFNLSGTELLTNPRFEVDLSSWTVDGACSWNSGGGIKLSSFGSTTHNFSQSGIPLTFGSDRKVLKIVFSEVNQDFNLSFDMDGASTTPVLITAAGTYYYPLYYSTTPATLTVSMQPTSVLGLDVVAVEVSLSDSSLCLFGGDSGWDFTDGGVTHQTGNTTVIYILSTTATGTASPYYGVLVNVELMGAGSLGVYLDGVLLGTITASGTYKYYATGTAGSNCELHPSSDFDGTVTYFDCLEYANDYAVEVTDLTGTPYLDLVGNASVTYIEDRINVIVGTGDDADKIQQGCYLIKLTETYPTTKTYTSGCLQVFEEMACGKLINAKGEYDSRTLGFLWGYFSLTHRIEFLKFNPEYPTDSEDYEPSLGTRDIVYAKREKYYTGKINYADETVHDTISTQIICKYFYIDGVRYFVKPQNYKPIWDKDGQYNLAQANIELRTHSGTIYTTNQ